MTPNCITITDYHKILFAPITLQSEFYANNTFYADLLNNRPKVNLEGLQSVVTLQADSTG